MRFRFTEPTDGALSVLRDVIVRREGDDGWIAISREAASAGETLVLDVDEDETPQRYTVCVVESRPIIVDGDMRHRIWLMPTSARRSFLSSKFVAEGPTDAP